MASKKWFTNGGSPKRGYYNGIWCDSSWELAFIIWCQDHKLEIIRNTKKFPYKWYNKIRYYQPDFIVNGKFYEVKGVMDGKSKRKINNFPFPIHVMDKKKMQDIIKFAKEKFGDDFADKLLKK